jgi:hypothetical protein
MNLHQQKLMLLVFLDYKHSVLSGIRKLLLIGKFGDFKNA